MLSTREASPDSLPVLERPRASRPAGRISIAAVAIWGLLIVVAHLWGEALLDAGRQIHLHAPPLVGVDKIRINARTFIPVLTALAVVGLWPALVSRLPWRRLLLACAGITAAWAVALALVDGVHGITGPLLHTREDYLPNIDVVGSPRAFLAHFTQRIGGYVTHVRGHPPGMLLLLWVMDRTGLGGTAWAAVLCIGGGALAVLAVLVAVRDVVDETTARRAAPFLCLAPAAIWIATTADAFFAGVSAWAITLIVLATARRDRRGDVFALCGGLLFGAASMLSYGLVLAAVIPACVAAWRRRARPLVIAAAGALIVLGAFALAGFSWLDGLAATQHQYAVSVARYRPYGYFFVSNLAAFGLALGPAIAVALVRLRDRRLWLLVGGAFTAIAVANLSGMSKGEVERIWLPFTIWVLAAGAVLVARRSWLVTRRWLALQAVAAITVETLVRTQW